MNSLTSIIIDDELHGRENLKTIIETYCNEIEVLDTAESASVAKELVLKHKPDVVFLDINMPVTDGFDFLEYFEQRNFMVVIVSAHSDYGVRAVKTQVEDFLLKPVHIKELQQTIEKLIELKKERSVSATQDDAIKITLPLSNGFEVVEVDDIIRFEADGCYTKVFLKEDRSLFISKTLKEFEESVPRSNFYRIHKSHLINLNHIKEYSRIDGGFVTLSSGSVIEVSRRKLPDFIQTVKKILNSSIE
jgi:two-component system, LytTR family, response regulator